MHDLDVLKQRISEPQGNGSDETDASADATIAVFNLIDGRRAELRLRAKPLGDRVYAEKPRAFAGRLQVYWSAWRVESEMEAMRAPENGDSRNYHSASS